MAKSIIQSGRYCYETRATNCPLDKHHIFNGNGLREWSEREGLWVYLSKDAHMEKAHKSKDLYWTLKRIGQYYYEKKHTRAEFMAHTRRNYLTSPLSDYEKEKYGIDVDELDLSECCELEKILNINQEINYESRCN